jgi:hypothetical protein
MRIGRARACRCTSEVVWNKALPLKGSKWAAAFDISMVMVDAFSQNNFDVNQAKFLAAHPNA